MTAYYNEIEPYAAQWLRNLIAAGHIAPGDVDERSIAEVQPDDLRGYTQCHFFAGIGVWSYALRLAGWGDDRPVWTGSCPCQPFSQAGKGRGHEDERHLWPVWERLIRELGPVIVFGEQVAGHDGAAWLDVVATDLESIAYAVGAVSAPACGFGAPHIRERLYWMAYSKRGADERQRLDVARTTRVDEGEAWQRERLRPDPGSGRAVDRMADDDDARCVRVGAARIHGRWPGESGDEQAPGDSDGAQWDDADGRGEAGWLGHGHGQRLPRSECETVERTWGREEGRAVGESSRSPLAGYWSDAVWLPCSDDKARPTKPGIFPLVDGASSRVGRLRAYGNAIVAPQAAEFIRAWTELTR